MTEENDVVADPAPPAIEPAPSGLSGAYIEPGMEGNIGNARQLVVIEQLADRSSNTMQERGMLLDSDMRDAMQRARAKLDTAARKYSVNGFTWNLDDVVYDNGSVARTITASLRISRDS